MKKHHPWSNLDADILDHIERETHENIECGMPPEEARYAALRKFGNLTLAKENARAVWIPVWLDQLRQDLRYALRMLRRYPGFTAIVVLSLGIGIGVNGALFGIIDELLLEPLPVHAPQELVLFNWLEGRKSMRTGMDGIRTTDTATGRPTSTSFSYPTFRRLQEVNQTLSEIFAFYPLQQLNVRSDDSSDIASGQYVSGNYFKGLGVTALIGRTITDDDDEPGAPPVGVITYEYWTRRFDRDPRVVGKTVIVNKVALTIIGITPQGFSGALEVTESPDFTLPFAIEPLMAVQRSDLQRPALLWVRLMGRLKPGVTREQAAAHLNATMQQSMLDEWRQAMAAGETAAGDSTRTLDDASTLRAEAGGQGLMDARRRYVQPILLLMGCGALVLLIACLNAANLLFARGTARQQEIAMRLALGARRGRIVRQLFTENMLMAILASAVGLPLALWGTGLLLIWRPWGGGPLVLEHPLDWRMLGFCTSVAILSALVFGIAPAARVTRRRVSPVTHRGAGGASAPVMKALVAGQVGTALVLLVAAVLFVETLRNLRAVETGFNAHNLLLFRVQPQLNGYTPGEIAALYSRMSDRIQTIPGVRSVTLARYPLLSFGRRASGIRMEGAPESAENGVEINIVATNFFETMEIPIVRGRAFDERDRGIAPKVAIVNELFAARHVSAANPIGLRFRFGRSDNSGPIEIVGIAKDAKYTDLRTDTQPTVYIPLLQDIPGQANFSVRTASDPLTLVASVRRVVHEIDPNVPLFDVKSQGEQAHESVAKETMFARLASVLGSIALLLAAIGLYGTMSYLVVRRTGEIGIRIALGAQRWTVTAMVLKDTLLMAVFGVTIGIPIALIVSRVSRDVLDQILFGLRPNDPLTIAGCAVILLLVAAIAGVVPARTASKVDPIIALRAE
jgi:predicted permease